MLQALTSRPLVKAVLEKMPDTQRDTASRLGADPVAAVQAGLQATVVEVWTWPRRHHAIPMLHLLPC